VLIHDHTVDRTTDGHGFVKDMTVAELKRLDAGAWFDARFAGERIPTLVELLAWARDRVPLAIEIKTAPSFTRASPARSSGLCESTTWCGRSSC